jgi:hypothetical protein
VYRWWNVEFLRSTVKNNPYFRLFTRSHMKSNGSIDGIHKAGTLQLPEVVLVDSSNRFFMTDEWLYVILLILVEEGVLRTATVDMYFDYIATLNELICCGFFYRNETSSDFIDNFLLWNNLKCNLSDIFGYPLFVNLGINLSSNYIFHLFCFVNTNVNDTSRSIQKCRYSSLKNVEIVAFPWIHIILEFTY